MPKQLYKINEIFGPSIQFEGSHSGTVAAFLRFAGCNLDCKFCDTEHDPFNLMDANEIIERLKATGCSNVVITGGEPLMQLDAALSMKLSMDFIVHLETNGSISLGENLGFINHITCSPKSNIDRILINKVDCLKFVHPFYPIQKMVDIIQKLEPSSIYLQPMDGEHFQENIHECIKRVNLLEGLFHPIFSRISIQTHKFVGLR